MLLTLLSLVACSSPEPARTVRFAQRLAAFPADAQAAANLFAVDATLSWVDEPAEARGRAAIEGAFRKVGEHYPGARIAVGRIWASDSASVVELLFTGTRAAGRYAGRSVGTQHVGPLAALVLTFNTRDEVRSARLYTDGVSYAGQVDPASLPEGVVGRELLTEVPNGTEVRVQTNGAAQRRNLALANAMWGSLSAHRAEDAMSLASESYVFDDYSAPKVLGRTETREMVVRFLNLLPDFQVVEKPVQISAGDEVVTELSEHATLRGRPVVLHGLDVKRFKDGRIDKEWQFADGAAALRQLTNAQVPVLTEP